MSETVARGLLDTSVIIDFRAVDSSLLPDVTAISAITVAELAAGPHATQDDIERSSAHVVNTGCSGWWRAGIHCRSTATWHERMA